MDFDFGLVCDYAYSGDNGKLFILGEFRYIRAFEFPATHPKMSLVFRITGYKNEGLEHKLKLMLVDADGNDVLPQLSKGEGPIRFGDSGPASVGRIQAQVTMELGGIKFEHEGDYRFDIFIDGQRLDGVPFHVMKIPKPSTS
ncbi:MAG: hypothetical protein IIB35_06870 [Gemmatimonadetes bacterium]|nr:hypothetical protein [Gemmatimonadota bacterium]